jgi:hypothetical protein
VGNEGKDWNATSNVVKGWNALQRQTCSGRNARHGRTRNTGNATNGWNETRNNVRNANGLNNQHNKQQQHSTTVSPWLKFGV